MQKNWAPLCCLLMVSVFAMRMDAQETISCGTRKTDTAAFTKARQMERTASARIQTTEYMLRVYFHVFKNDNGLFPAAIELEIDDEYQKLVEKYAPNNICFIKAGFEYINSSFLNNDFNADTDPDGNLLRPFEVAGCINVFYMQKINGNNTACNPPCGYGGIAIRGIPGTIFLVARESIGGNTISHEMGHCLGLLHTFETSHGLETINGDNADDAGDLITDTHADPYAYNGAFCYSVSADGCTYTGFCNDPNGQSNFNPPYNNLMSYWKCVPNRFFTSNQFLRMRAFLDTYSGLLLASSPSTVTVADVTKTTGEYLLQSSLNSLSTSGSVIIQNGAIGRLWGSSVTLKPGFFANPSGNGITEILPKPCN